MPDQGAGCRYINTGWDAPEADVNNVRINNDFAKSDYVLS